MKIKSILAAALLVFAVSANAQDAIYGIKSGIITTEMDMMGNNIVSKQYFDDYGKKVATVSEGGMMGGSGETRTITDADGARITINEAEKTATKMPSMGGFGGGMMGGGAAINWMKLDDQMMKDNNIKALGEETIAGKACKKYSVTSEGFMGEQTQTVWIYEGITMKSSTAMGDFGEMVQTVTKLEENVAVDAKMFTVPEGIEVTEFDMSQFGGFGGF